MNVLVKDAAVGGYHDIVKYKKDLSMNAFTTGNYQYFRNLQDYQYVKYNYFAIKIHELAYVGYDKVYTGGSGGDPKPYSMGVNSMDFSNHGMYFAWDLEENIGVDSKTVSNYVNPENLASYPFAKKYTPRSRPVSFLYRVPVPWRQFIETNQVRNTTTNQFLTLYFATLTGVKNLRAPGYLFGTHPNWWSAALPDANNLVNMSAVVGMTLYMGCTFRGRRTHLDASVSFAPENEVEQHIEVNLEKE